MYFLNCSKSTVCRKLKRGEVFHVSMLSFVSLASHQLEKRGQGTRGVISPLIPAPPGSVWARRQPGPREALRTPNPSDDLPVPPQRSLRSPRVAPGSSSKKLMASSRLQLPESRENMRLSQNCRSLLAHPRGGAQPPAEPHWDAPGLGGGLSFSHGGDKAVP